MRGLLTGRIETVVWSTIPTLLLGIQDFGRTYEVNPAQLQDLDSVDLMQQVKKAPIFEIKPQFIPQVMKLPQVISVYKTHFS